MILARAEHRRHAVSAHLPFECRIKQAADAAGIDARRPAPPMFLGGKVVAENGVSLDLSVAKQSFFGGNSIAKNVHFGLLRTEDALLLGKTIPETILGHFRLVAEPTFLNTYLISGSILSGEIHRPCPGALAKHTKSKSGGDNGSSLNHLNYLTCI